MNDYTKVERTGKAAKTEVLLVDDEAVWTLLVKEALAAASLLNVRLTTAGSLAEARQHLREKPCDLVLLDLTLPDSSGTATFEQIRAEFPKIPVVVVSANDDMKVASRLLRAGAQDYLRKGPSIEPALGRVVAFAIERQRFQIELGYYALELERKESQLRHILNASSDGILVVDKEGIIRFCTPAAAKMFGRPQEELICKPFGFPVVGGATTELELVQKGRRTTTVEMRVVETVWNAQPVSIALLRDISERKQAEEALRQSEMRFKHLADSNMVGVIRMRADGSILEANDTFLRMVGYTRQEFETGKMDWSNMTPPEYVGITRRFFTELMHEGQGTPIEKEYVSKDGKRVPVLLGGVLMEDSSDETICVALDLSSRRLLEEQLRQTSKMEAIGRLAGGVAHDFNNLLTIINGYTQLLAERFPPEDPSQVPLKMILEAGSRATALTRQLLAFGRRQVIAPQTLNLNGIVSGIEKMIQRLIGEDIELLCHLEESLSSVKADPGQMEQVVMNLVVNSRDAMPRGGKLTIETADVELDDTYCRSHAGAAPGRYVMLGVSDTGVGIDKETQSHIFEPFFTTKGDAKGTGLGLATVHGIVKQSGGSIKVYSEPGKGATFKVYLPRCESMANSVRAAQESEKAQGGSETILLLEDEEAVKALASEILQERGYTVLATTSAQEALQISKRHQGAIHALLTDVVMPQMSGPKVAKLLASHRPQTKVLYMSGYTDNAIVHHGILDPGTAFLQKPFTPETLARKVRQVLDSPDYALDAQKSR